MKRVLVAVLKAAAPVILLYVMQALVVTVALLSGVSAVQQVSLLTLIADMLVVAAVFAWYRWRRASACAEMKVGVSGAAPLVFAALVGVGFCILIQWMMMTVPFPQDWLSDYELQSSVITLGSPIWRWLATVVVAPIAEEIVYRGLCYRFLKQAMPRWWAAVLASAVFGAMHGSPLWMLYTFMMSMVLISLYEDTGSLLAPIVCHMAFNLMGQLPLLSVVPLWATVLIVIAGAVLFVKCFMEIKAMRRTAEDGEGHNDRTETVTEEDPLRDSHHQQ